MNPVYIYKAEVLDVHDGDTLKLRVDLGFRCAVTIQCRLHGVDCPELEVNRQPNPAGVAARQFVIDELDPAHEGGFDDIVVQSYKDQRSFERWVCDVWLADGRSLAQIIVEAGQGAVIA